MDRRQFLKACGFGAICVGLGQIMMDSAAAAPPPGKTRPPGTCGGYTDADSNGSCDHSEKKVKPCGALRCPGHAKNTARQDDAPKGTCAQWKDLHKKGICDKSTAATQSCQYAVCPANKLHAGNSGNSGKPA